MSTGAITVGTRVRVPADWWNVRLTETRIGEDDRVATCTSASHGFYTFAHDKGARSQGTAQGLEVLPAELPKERPIPAVGQVWWCETLRAELTLTRPHERSRFDWRYGESSGEWLCASYFTNGVLEFRRHAPTPTPETPPTKPGCARHATEAKLFCYDCRELTNKSRTRNRKETGPGITLDCCGSVACRLHRTELTHVYGEDASLLPEWNERKGRR